MVGHTAVETIDGMLTALHRAGAALVSEIHYDQYKTVAGVDAMVASRA